MRQQDRFNNTYTYTSTPAQHKHMQKRGQQSWNTTGPRQRSQDSNNNRPHRSVQILEEALLQWTLEQHTKAKEKEKERTKEKDMAKATKEKDTNKEKPMEATAHTTKEKPKENNNHGTSQKEETKATKKRQKERLAKEKGRVVLQMWPTRPHGKGLPNSGVQDVRDTTGTEPRCNSTMVRPKQWVWQLLVQQRPIRQLQHSSSPTTTTSFASTTNRQSNTISPTCGNTGSSGSECPQGNDNNASSLTTKRIHRGRDHDRQRCSRTRLSNMVCTRHTTVSITIWTRSEAQDSNRWRHLSAWLQTGVHAQHQQANTGCSLLCVRRHTTKRNTNNHTQQGFNSALRQREGLYFLPVTLVTLPAKQTTARIAPVTLTPTGMEILRNNNDLWTFNSQGFLVRVHRTQRNALFMPDSRCPAPTERLENYRRTVIQWPNNNTEVTEEAYQDLDKKQQKRVIQGHNWTEETWFKVKRGTPLPGNIPPQPALPPAKGTTPATSRQLTADEPQAPMYRHNVKKPLTEVRPTGQAMTSTQTHQTAIPYPKEVSPTQDYWIKEGPYWKRVHVQPRRDMYIPQQTDDGPDVTKLTTWRQTMVKPTSGNLGYRIDDDWTTKRKATLDIEWTGSTNFENTA